MFPVYGYIDPCCRPFPYPMEPNLYPCRYHPGWQVMPPQMKEESIKHPSLFGPCSFSNNMVPSNSGDHGSCCHHSSSPGYCCIRPQFSHIQPASQLYYHGPYTPYPDSCPAYFVPPPHYSVDQARYDYDKAWEHCCGCPNHTYHRRHDNSPKIEEQRPEKEQDRGSSGLVCLPNYPSPVVWVPTSSVKDGEGEKAAQSQPGCWNNWMPINISGLNGSGQEDEVKKVQQDGDKSSHKRSSFPVFWMSDYDKSEGPAKDLREITPKSVEGWPSKFKIIPLKLLENESKGEGPKAELKGPKSAVQAESPTQTESKTKTIPVKQMDERSKVEASIPDKHEGNVEKLEEENEVIEASGKKGSSPVRSSKLPPVCLRVDPLPRRKTNGTSRSPSPPGHKNKRNHQQKEEQSCRGVTREDVSEKVIPIVNMKDNTWSQSDKERKFQDTLSVASLKDSSKESLVQETVGLSECLKAGDIIEGGKIGGEKDSMERMSSGDCGSNQKTEGNKIEMDNGCTKSSEREVKEKKGMKRELSQSDAALIIQSAYRGYEVRRWHPLEKLKKVARVREQVGNLRRQIESIESSSKHLNAKQQMVIGEAIMSLLLELDTIQGLHPSAREARKCVARELVCLQEKLDSLVKQIAEEHGSTEVEAVTEATDVAAFTGSCAEGSKGESLEDKIDSTGNATTKEAAECHASHGDLPSNVKVVNVVGSSASGEPTTVQESAWSAEDIGVEAEPSSGNVGTNGSDSEIIIVDSSSLAIETVLDEGTKLSVATEMPVQPSNESSASLKPSSESKDSETERPSGLVQMANENGATENPSSESKESGSRQETTEDSRREGRLVLTVIENGASENPSLENKKYGSTKQETLEDRREEGQVTESSGSANASFLAGDGPCERNSSSDAVAYVGEDVSMLAPEDAFPSLGGKGLSEPLGESKYQECKAALFDYSFEDDAYGHHKLEEPPVLTSVQDDNTGQIALPIADGRKLTLDAGESIVHVTEEDKPESEMISSLVQREDSHDTEEEVPVLLSVDRNDDIFMCVPAKVDIASETMSESLQLSGCQGVAENNDDGLKAFIGVSQSHDEEPKGVHDKIEGPAGRVHLSVDRDAIVEVEAGHAPVVGQGTYALVLTKGSEDHDRSGECRGIRSANANTNIEEKKILEENEKLREMLQRLLDAGKEQLGVILDLNGRVKDLERKVAQKKWKRKVKRNGPAKLHSSRVSC